MIRRFIAALAVVVSLGIAVLPAGIQGSGHAVAGIQGTGIAVD